MPQLLNRAELNSDGIGYVEQYDFSRANLSQESRIKAVTFVASVCYQNPKALGSVSLYDRLATESRGLPSSSYEFVPVLLTVNNWAIVKAAILNLDKTMTDCEKYGEWIDDGTYLLTNLRALISDVGDRADEFYNTKKECNLIAKYFKVFKSKIDLSTRSQYIRHRASWQELSRRYVSGKKSEFEFYKSDKMNFISQHADEVSDIFLDANDFHNLCVSRYNQAIEMGVKPEEARRCLPQSMYTTVWSAWQPAQLSNFFKLRLDKHAQHEIRHLAQAKQQLLGDTNDN